MSTTQQAIAKARELWAQAQSQESISARLAGEYEAWSLYIETVPEDSNYDLRLAECVLGPEGDRPGWAFSYSGGIYWSPTRGEAKRMWGSMRRTGGRDMVGDRPQPCTESDAIRWDH